MSFGTDLLAGLRGVRDKLESDGHALLPAVAGLVRELEPLAGGDTTVLERAAVDLVKTLAGDAAAHFGKVPAAGTSARLDALETRMERVEHLMVPPAESTLPAGAQGGTVSVADQKAAGVAPGDTVTVADQRAGVPAPEGQDPTAVSPTAG